MTAPISSRDLPAPWGVCDVCGRAAGLPDPDSRGQGHMCATCAVRRTLTDAAQHDLKALTGPVVGAWAAHWTRAGLTVEEMDSAAEALTAAWAKESYARRFRRVFLRRLARRHAAPAYFEEAPTRQTFAPARVVAFHPAETAHAWPTFETADGRRHTLPRGLDAVILEEADGSRAVVFIGFAGQLSFENLPEINPPSFRVPAALWPAFHAALSGEEKDLSSFAVGQS
ncbi:hypothetical protein [Deinococcus frigens]|uniref:hypothetical protein n=1 Tax=Deinococcus frigens TaxID=249403 RepID=UPI00049617AB|nr:hypothetical protein [Deinococcus frigens]